MLSKRNSVKADSFWLIMTLVVQRYDLGISRSHIHIMMNMWMHHVYHVDFFADLHVNRY